MIPKSEKLYYGCIFYSTRHNFLLYFKSFIGENAQISINVIALLFQSGIFHLESQGKAGKAK